MEGAGCDWAAERQPTCFMRIILYLPITVGKYELYLLTAYKIYLISVVNKLRVYHRDSLYILRFILYLPMVVPKLVFSLTSHLWEMLNICYKALHNFFPF